MSMRRRRVDALHVVERERRIDEEAEQSCSDQIPYQNTGEECEWPLVDGLPFLLMLDLGAVVGFEPDDHQWNDLERGEYRAQRNYRDRRPAEIEVMERAEHPATEEDNGRQQDRSGRNRNADQPHLDEQRGDDGGGEDLENAFDPQMDNPPAPIFHDRDVGVLPVEQARTEQEPD